jgi:hypothetical protein
MDARAWTGDEDQKLQEAVQLHCGKDWSQLLNSSGSYENENTIVRFLKAKHCRRDYTQWVNGQTNTATEESGMNNGGELG